MDDRIKEEIMKRAKDGKIPCPVARRIGRELSVGYAEIGRAADELGIKIINCELGCF